ncbi:MAG TPA: methylmalonyl-CoA mutase family protein, partial [Ramlibacter sp.]|nr:methylmalonyl-CoA mutase family protein [Ramlibacter sp.]
MNKPIPGELLTTDAHQAWQQEYAATIGTDKDVANRSGIPIKPLYTERDWPAERAGELGLPGQPPYTRGIYATMHRGRTWTQRQLIGLGTPAEYNARLREMLDQGATAISLIPCNSVFRGYDMDESHIELLGTCGTVINTWEHMHEALSGVDLARTSCAQNDPSPFTLLA